MRIDSWQELEVYRSAFALQQAVFERSKSWPKEELYALTDQVRRASRSIGANLAEAWAKRRYPAHFLSTLTDADAELQETLHWIATARACGCLSGEDSSQLGNLASTTGRQLGAMMNRHETFCH